MARLLADPDLDRWVPVTGSLGWKGRRHRKAAVVMMMDHLNRSVGGRAGPDKGVRHGIAAWGLSQVAPLLMRKADGRVLVWVWRREPKLVVVMAQVQEATSELRTARAMLPMEYDDTESFRSPFLGVGEKLVLPERSMATYTWDTGSHFVTITAVSSDQERFGTILPAIEELVRTVRLTDEFTVGESPDVLRIDPA